MNISDWIKSAASRLKSAECGDATEHSRRILAETMGVSLAQIFSRPEEILSKSDLDRLEKFLERRVAGEPFQYIVGYEEFWKSRFRVGPGVFIPRKETEHLVEEVLKLGSGETSLTIAELGAGSGNIGLSVVLERPQWRWIAYEKNPETLPYLRENAQRLLPDSDAYQIFAEDFLCAQGSHRYDAIVSNPPYIARGEKLSKEVTSEPELALYGGERGWEVLERLALLASDRLVERGVFLSEIGSTQEEVASRILLEAGFENVQVIRDYQGLPRIAKGIKGGSSTH
jgi:release factor glutamine methyltransferase